MAALRNGGAAALARHPSRGRRPYSVYSRPLSADVPEKIYLVAFRSLLAQQLYVSSVLFSYLTAFLVTLAASLFLAAGFTSLTISPFTRLSQWLHRYMDTGEVGKLDIRSRDEIGFLAGAFHGMVSTLIDEKRVIGEQLDQISVLNAYNERIMNAIPAGIIVTGPEGSIEFCNGYFADLVRCGVEPLKGRPLRDADGAQFHAAQRRAGGQRVHPGRGHGGGGPEARPLRRAVAAFHGEGFRHLPGAAAGADPSSCWRT